MTFILIGASLPSEAEDKRNLSLERHLDRDQKRTGGRPSVTASERSSRLSREDGEKKDVPGDDKDKTGEDTTVLNESHHEETTKDLNDGSQSDRGEILITGSRVVDPVDEGLWLLRIQESDEMERDSQRKSRKEEIASDDRLVRNELHRHDDVREASTVTEGLALDEEEKKFGLYSGIGPLEGNRRKGKHYNDHRSEVKSDEKGLTTTSRDRIGQTVGRSKKSSYSDTITQAEKKQHSFTYEIWSRIGGKGYS